MCDQPQRSPRLRLSLRHIVVYILIRILVICFQLCHLFSHIIRILFLFLGSHNQCGAGYAIFNRPLLL